MDSRKAAASKSKINGGYKGKDKLRLTLQSIHSKILNEEDSIKFKKGLSDINAYEKQLDTADSKLEAINANASIVSKERRLLSHLMSKNEVNGDNLVPAESREALKDRRKKLKDEAAEFLKEKKRLREKRRH